MGLAKQIKHSPLSAPLTIMRMASKGYINYPSSWPNEEQDIQNILNEIKETGFYVAKGYYNSDQCKLLRDEIDRVLTENENSCSYDDLIGDMRLFGAEKVSDEIMKFNKDPYLQKLSDLYHGAHAPAPFTLGARLKPNDINKDKDHGWHRDSLRRQFKTIIYLSDVDEDSGPFQYIVKSHHKRYIFSDVLHAGIPYMSAAIAPEAAQQIIKKNPDRLKTVTGRQGDLIITDTTGIHRGSTIKSGTRYALTNYYMFEDSIGDHLNSYFGPMAYRA